MLINEKIEAVIFNGGRGYRLAELTGGEIPKGYLKFESIPLISYQIKAILNTGIQDITIVVSSDKAKNDFLQFISDKLVPQANYNIVVIEYKRENSYSSPYFYYSNPLFTSNIGKKALLALNSDNVFKSSDLNDLVQESLSDSFNSSYVTTFNKPASKNPFLIENFKIIEQNKDMFVEDSDITGITLYSQSDLNILKEGLKQKEPHVHKAIKCLIDNKRTVHVKNLSFFINMNTINEYNQVLDYINSNPNW